jgi:hypothetical protein
MNQYKYKCEHEIEKMKMKHFTMNNNIYSFSPLADLFFKVSELANIFSKDSTNLLIFLLRNYILYPQSIYTGKIKNLYILYQKHIVESLFSM